MALNLEEVVECQFSISHVLRAGLLMEHSLVMDNFLGRLDKFSVDNTINGFISFIRQSIQTPSTKKIFSILPFPNIPNFFAKFMKLAKKQFLTWASKKFTRGHEYIFGIP